MNGPGDEAMSRSLPATSEGLFGVYVHIPFCRHRCDYCAFATFTDKDHIIAEYLSAMSREIELATDVPDSTSIFVGGGTPTRVPPRDLVAVLSCVRRTTDAEVTIECNPDDVSEESFRIYASAGVNRISLGVQSMRVHVLQSLGRTHDPENVRRAVESARAAGIDNINLDIIYGAHGESLDDWEATVRGVIALEPDHVSAYGLTVEAGTPLAEDRARHPDDDVQAEMYDCVDDILGSSGFANYEVSNWAKPNRESRHNFTYWLQGDYRGFGTAAHSHHRGARWWNVRTPERYIELVRERGEAESAREVLDEEQQRIESLQLVLRTRLGVPIDAFAPDDLALMEDLVVSDGERVRLTRAGRLLANEVSMRLR
ncbi:MAG: putative oxygen-independent coproporphyrinogen oxidase [Actinomycetota bacterium]|jgi:oxygen-independent coproporphyrinogen-3 oxidase